MDALQSIKDKVQDIDNRRKAALEEVRKEFPALLTPFLERSAKITSIGWRQYTPYFNDGDECTFSANVDSLSINGEDEDDEELGFLTPYIGRVIRNEQDKLENDEVAEALGYSWYKKVQIGTKGIAWNPAKDDAEIQIIKDLKEVLRAIPEDFYKELFGDHVTVTVTKSGEITTEQYEHD